MTTFEYFKNQYDNNHDYAVECIHKEIEVDSFHFVEVAAKCAFGGTADTDPYFNINGVDDTHEMKEKKYVSFIDGYRCGKPVRFVKLTKRGLKAFYKAMF